MKYRFNLYIITNMKYRFNLYMIINMKEYFVQIIFNLVNNKIQIFKFCKFYIHFSHLYYKFLYY